MINHKMKILVVDDFETMRRIIRRTLRGLGFQNISEADNARAALQKLHHERFDFVITEWTLPGMSGLELLQAIRADESLRHIPVLMVTAEASKEYVVQAARAGVNGYIVKPFKPEIMRGKIEEIFATKPATQAGPAAKSS